MNVNLLVCHVDILVIAIAFALISILSIQYNYGGDAEIHSELLCWITIVVGVELCARCFDKERGLGKEKEKHFHYSALVVAAGVAVGSFCRSVDDVRWISVCHYQPSLPVDPRSADPQSIATAYPYPICIPSVPGNQYWRSTNLFTFALLHRLNMVSRRNCFSFCFGIGTACNNEWNYDCFCVPAGSNRNISALD